MIRTKSCIVLTWDVGLLEQASVIIDEDECTAKELWIVLEKKYTTSNAQAVLNLQIEMENMEYKDGNKWKERMKTIYKIIGKHSAYDGPIKDEEKPSKIFKTLPPLCSFSLLAIVLQASDTNFQNLANAIEG